MDKMIIYTHSSEILFPSLTGVIRFLIQLYGSKKTISENMEFPSLTGVIRFLIVFVLFVFVVVDFFVGFRPLQGLFVF